MPIISMPEPSASTTPTAVGLFGVSLGLVRGPGAAQFVNSALTSDLGRIGPGRRSHALTAESGGGDRRPDRLPTSATTRSFGANAANTAAVVGALQASGRSQASPICIGPTRCWPYRGRVFDRHCSPRSGLPAEMDYMGYADASLLRVRCVSHRHTVKHGTNCCRRSAGGVRRCWRYQPQAASPAGLGARDFYCALKWAILARARAFAGHLAAAGPMHGWAVGGRTLFLVVRRCWPKAAGRGGCCGSCAWSVTVCCARAGCACRG